MQSEEKKTFSKSAFDRKITRVRFYLRVKRWLLSLAAIALLTGGITWYVRSRPVANKNQDIHVDLAQGEIVILPDHQGFDYTNMMNLMNEYSTMKRIEMFGTPWNRVPQDRVSLLLQNLSVERQTYSAYLRRMRQDPVFEQNRRKKRAWLHYMRSLEEAIAELKGFVTS